MPKAVFLTNENAKRIFFNFDFGAGNQAREARGTRPDPGNRFLRGTQALDAPEQATDCFGVQSEPLICKPDWGIKIKVSKFQSFEVSMKIQGFEVAQFQNSKIFKNKKQIGDKYWHAHFRNFQIFKKYGCCLNIQKILKFHFFFQNCQANQF